MSVSAIKGLSARAIRQASASKKLLPHELLLLWANGIEIGGLQPSPAQQLYAAVAAAPYYAPKLANIEVKQDVRVRAVISAQPMTQEEWSKKYLNTETVELTRTPKTLTDIVSENYFSNGDNKLEGVGVGATSPQPVVGLLGKVTSALPMQANELTLPQLNQLTPQNNSGNSEPAAFSGETNRKSSDDAYISPSTAHPNLSRSTEQNIVFDDDSFEDDDDVL